MGLKYLANTLLIAFLLIALCGSQNSYYRAINSNIYISSGKDFDVTKIKSDITEIEKQNATVQSKIEEYLKTKHVNGGVAVIQNKKIIFNQGVGYSNLVNKTLNRPTTTYPIGSITKTFVATSIMQLQEKGMLSIYDPVSKYIPNFPNGKKIKLINFLTHTSGIEPPNWNPTDKTPADLIHDIEKQPIAYSAGSKWNYLDANYMVLGYILEKLTGTSLHQYIQKNIFDKALMKDSGFMTAKDPVPYNSNGYILENGIIRQSDNLNINVLYACGDIYTTALDLAKYDQALMNGELVSKNSLEMILTPGSPSKYGLGLYNVGYAIFSRGVVGGWNSVHVYYMNGTGIVVLLNILNRQSEIQQISTDIYQILDTEKSLPAPKSSSK